MLRVGFRVLFILGGEFKGCVRPTLRLRNRFSSNKNRAVRHNAILARVIKPAVKGIAAPPTPTGFYRLWGEVGGASGNATNDCNQKLFRGARPRR
jgi:hypothetical protein